MKETRTWVLVLLAAVIAVGCEIDIPSPENSPDMPNLSRYMDENSRSVEAMAPQIVQPAYVKGGFKCPVGAQVTFRVRGGSYPFQWNVSPNRGYMKFTPDDEFDFRTFTYVSQSPGACNVSVVDRDKRADTMDVINFDL